MKKLIVLSIVLVSIFTTTFAQNIPITGEFKTQYDNWGNASIYFEGKNISNYPIYNISVSCVNEALGQKSDFTQAVLLSGYSFYIGVGQNWVWQTGEKLFLTVNGQTVYWQYGQQQNYNNTQQQSNRYSEKQKQIRIQQIDLQIRQLGRKVADAEKSLKYYQSLDPGATNMMLINSQQNLINTYNSQIRKLQNEKMNLLY